MTNTDNTKAFVLGRLIHLLMLLVLAGLWGVVITFSWSERDLTLERIQEQLATTVITLADFNELAEQAATLGLQQDTDTRTEALWRALLQYPALNIWVEDDGVLTGGLPPADSSTNAITVQEARSSFTVYAALPIEDALREWQQFTRQRIVALIAVTLVFLVLTQFLVRALRLRHVAEQKVTELARVDALTGIPNRRTFNERLDLLFAATRRGGNPFAVFYMDLDRFKTINDTLGHAIGDAMLVETARRLQATVRATDLVARLGGDEFAVLQTDVMDPAAAALLAENIHQRMREPMRLDGNELYVTTSMGICPWSPSSPDPANMLSQADVALYRAKEEGRDRYCFHSRELDQQVQARNLLATELRQAIDFNGLLVAWRAQIGINDGKIAGLKAVLRWQHPRLGLLEAQDFVPTAEKSGNMILLGQWLLAQSCRQLRAWRDAGLVQERIAMNLSLLQLKNVRELEHSIVMLTGQYGLTPADLEFDVTESMLAQLTLVQNAALQRLRQLGCMIGIDNFGADYSTFDYIRSYQVRSLILSRASFHAALAAPEQAATLGALLGMAQELNLAVIVEGVETEVHHTFLQTLGHRASQHGYYYSDPVDGSTAGSLLRGSDELPPGDEQT